MAVFGMTKKHQVLQVTAVMTLVGTLILIGVHHFDGQVTFLVQPALKTICPESNGPEWTDRMSAEELMEYFRWGNQTSCKLVHDFGGQILGTHPSGVDGQKAVCLDPGVAPPQADCIVYSFGISNEWSFDEWMEKYGCQVFAFDPSMTDQKDQFDHSPGVHFYKLGLGVRDETIGGSGWKIRTLQTIYRMLNHEATNRIIDYLKMDIEYNEWAVLPNLVQSGMLSKVRQMGIEIHLPSQEPLSKYQELANILRDLEDRHGMIRFDSKANPWYRGNFTQLGLSGSFGYEIAWYNTKLSK